MKSLVLVLALAMGLGLAACDRSSSSNKNGDGGKHVPLDQEDSVQKAIPNTPATSEHTDLMKLAMYQYSILNDALDEGCEHTDCAPFDDGDEGEGRSGYEMNPKFPRFNKLSIVDSNQPADGVVSEVIYNLGLCDFEHTGNSDISPDNTKVKVSEKAQSASDCIIDFGYATEFNGTFGESSAVISSTGRKSARLKKVEWAKAFNINSFAEDTSLNINASRAEFHISALTTVSTAQFDGSSHTTQISVRIAAKMDSNGEPIPQTQALVAAILFKNNVFSVGGELISTSPQSIVYKINKQVVTKAEFEKAFGEVGDLDMAPMAFNF